MEATYPNERVRVAVSYRDSAVSFAALLLVCLSAFLAIRLQSAPDAVPEGAPPSEFSSGRAMNYLRAVAETSHPIGSLQHDGVRAYICQSLTEMGLAPTVQETTAIAESRRGIFMAGTVRNIVVRLKGSENSRAVALVGHYDSVPNGNGASDDGSAVAAMIETARALKTNDNLKNDIILLFTDGEEAESVGAKAFVEEHPWAKDIGLVLNFEARGSSGPSFMFETSSNNGWLIGEFSKAAAHPRASSLARDLYKMLPNDTDVTVFKRAGLSCLNFAFIDGSADYHSQLDTVARIDERSLQHQGSYMLSLARHFGAVDLTKTTAADAIYFNPVGSVFVQYSSRWVLPLAGVVLVVLAAVILLGFKRQVLTLRGVALGALAFLLNLILAPALAFLVWWVINRFDGDYMSAAQTDVYNGTPFMLGFVLLGSCTASVIHALFRGRITFHNHAAGALILLTGVSLAIAILLPGASYLFTWPLLLSLFALGLTFGWSALFPSSAGKLAVICLSALPAVILFAPIIQQLYVALTVRTSWAVMVLVVLGLGLLTLPMELISGRRKWRLPVVMAAAAAGFLVTAIVTSGFDADHPKPDSLFYILDADQNKAMWASSDRAPDQWTSQFLSSDVRRGTLFDYFPLNPRPHLKSQAQASQLDAPEATIIEDRTSGDIRTVRLRIVSPRKAPVISLYLDSDDGSIQTSLNGSPLVHRTPDQIPGMLAMHYFALPHEGIEISVKTLRQYPLKLKLVDRTYQLPNDAGITVRARPAGLIPAPFTNTDSTFVSKSFTL